MSTSLSPAQALTSSELPVTWDSPCQKVRFVGVRGSGETDRSFRGLGAVPSGVIDSAISSLPADFGAENVGISALSYPAVIQSAADYNASVETGVAELAKRLKARNKLCPNERVFLVGHSQGAHVIHRLLLRDEFAKAPWISQASLFADPARPLNAKTNSAGTFNALAVTAGQPLERNIPKTVRNKVKNVCSNYDIICSNPLEATLAFVMAGISTACDTHNGGYFGKPRSGCWSRPPLATPAVRDILTAVGLSEESFNNEMSVNRVAAEGQRLAKLAAQR
jgi:hypothetical protein